MKASWGKEGSFWMWFHEVRVYNGGEGKEAGARSREITFYPYTER